MKFCCARDVCVEKVMEPFCVDNIIDSTRFYRKKQGSDRTLLLLLLLLFLAIVEEQWENDFFLCLLFYFCKVAMF